MKSCEWRDKHEGSVQRTTVVAKQGDNKHSHSLRSRTQEW
jgi:hypothetical protein